MFHVIKEKDNSLGKVYSVKKDTNNITWFLFYQNNKWVWEPADGYRPATPWENLSVGKYEPLPVVAKYHGLVSNNHIDDGK